jgi:hypothetical protein
MAGIPQPPPPGEALPPVPPAPPAEPMPEQFPASVHL